MGRPVPEYKDGPERKRGPTVVSLAAAVTYFSCRIHTHIIHTHTQTRARKQRSHTYQMEPKKKKAFSKQASRPPPANRSNASPSAPLTVCALVENRARETCIAVINTSHSSVIQVCVWWVADGVSPGVVSDPRWLPIKRLIKRGVSKRLLYDKSSVDRRALLHTYTRKLHRELAVARQGTRRVR